MQTVLAVWKIRHKKGTISNMKPSDIDQSILKLAHELTMFIAKKSSEATRDKKIRMLLDWHGLDQTEQDRIFNEFVLSGQCLYYFSIEQLSKSIVDNAVLKDKLQQLSFAFLPMYGSTLLALGTPKKFVKLWSMALEQRLT